MWPNPQETANLVTFTEEILNVKLYFLCNVFVTIFIIIFYEFFSESKLAFSPFETFHSHLLWCCPSIQIVHVPILHSDMKTLCLSHNLSCVCYYFRIPIILWLSPHLVRFSTISRISRLPAMSFWFLSSSEMLAILILVMRDSRLDQICMSRAHVAKTFRYIY